MSSATRTGSSEYGTKSAILRGGVARGGLRVRGVYSGVDVEMEEEDVVGEVYRLFD